MPGRKRPTKKQISTDRVNSEISLNGGDTTSESESESLLVSGACSQTATIDSGNPSLHSLALSTAEESNPAPTSDCLQSCLSANEDTHTVGTIQPDLGPMYHRRGFNVLTLPQGLAMTWKQIPIKLPQLVPSYIVSYPVLNRKAKPTIKRCAIA